MRSLLPLKNYLDNYSQNTEVPLNFYAHDRMMSCFQVNYINAHATSTLAGDLAEVNAVKQVFKNPSEIKMKSAVP